jgi:hypothetical protein
LTGQVEVWLNDTALGEFKLSVAANGVPLQESNASTATDSPTTTMTVFGVGERDLAAGTVIEVTSAGLKRAASASIRAVTPYPCRECLR